MDTGKKKSRATITAVHNEGGGDESGDDDDAEGEDNGTPSATPSTSGSGSGDAERELRDSAVPKSKPSGKKQSERSEFQTKLLDFLERDLQKDDKDNQQPDDPIDLQVMSMAQRIKKELPQSEQFNILLKLQQLLNESIMQVNRRQFLNKIPWREKVSSRLVTKSRESSNSNRWCKLLNKCHNCNDDQWFKGKLYRSKTRIS